MTNSNNRISSKLEKFTLRQAGRPKGRKFDPVTFTLTREEIDYLQTKPNASELIRKLLDDLITTGKDVEEKLGAISLKNQLEELEKRKNELINERLDYIQEKKAFHYSYWQTEKGENGYEKIKWAEDPSKDSFKRNPIARDNEDGRLGLKVVEGYNEAIKAIETRIEEIKNKIMQG